jgi:hypothetical protein
VIIISPKLEAGLDAGKAGLMAKIFELRPGTFLEIFVQTNLWSAYLEHQPK